jgi:hypothetical protein
MSFTNIVGWNIDGGTSISLLYTGEVEEDSTTISIDAIRRATIIMSKATMYKEISIHLQSIIDEQKVQLGVLQDNLNIQKELNVKLTNKVNEEVDRSRKLKKQRNIFAGSTGILTIIYLVLLL